MAYRIEKEEAGNTALVIDGWENGIASSPFKGIGNIKNLNVKYYEGIAYVNYKRKAATIQNSGGISSQTFTVTVASPAVFTSTGHGFVANETVVFSTTGALPTGLTAGTVYYIISAGLTSDTFEVSTSRGGSAVNTTGTQSGTQTFTVCISKPLYACQSPANLIYFSDDNRNIWKQVTASGSVFKHLTGNNANVDIGGLAYWNNYLFTIGSNSGGRIEVCGTGAGDSTITSTHWNNTQTANNFTVTIATPAVFTLSNHGLSAGDRVRLSTDGALPTGLSTSVDYFVISGGLTNDNFEVSTTSGGSAVNTTGSQSGTHTLTYDTGLWPIINGVTITFTTRPVGGATSATGFTYTDAGGTSRNFWNGPTGFYNLEFLLPSFGGGRQIVLANFTQGSNEVTWTPALSATPSADTATLFYNSNSSTATGVTHMSLVAANTGDLYFCNGPYVGALVLTPNQIFNKSDMNTFTFYSNIIDLPTTDTATWLMELRNNLCILGKFTMYPWDFFSPSFSNPVPIDESLIKGINILNNLYVFAGVKGNIYISNGYNFERYAKLPDYIAGVIDPSWSIGGVMQHRQKLFFQALAKNGQTDAAIFQGIFSLDLDNRALVMEGQGSAGLVPSGITSPGLLIDDKDTSINYAKYYSAFSATNSFMDYNDTTLYSSNEAVIETDIIPIGTFAQPRTFNTMEFKLDQPLQSGDSISVYVRNSLSENYALVGTTTTAVLSDLYQQNWQKGQWVQFKITASCNPTSTSSSFVRLREIRIR